MTIPYTLTNISAVGNVLLQSGPGILNQVSINTGAANAVLSVYDGLNPTGTAMGKIDASTPRILNLQWPFKVGCFLNLTGGGGVADITIS